MKPTTNILPRILFILLLSLLLPLKGLAQCANITVTTTKQDSPCSNNGQITVLVTGDDIANGKYFDLQYRVYRPGIDPELWVDENTHNNLVAGTYKIDIRGKCQEAGGGYIEVPNAAPDVTIDQADWVILNMEAEASLDAFECMAEGQVKFTSVSGGTGPYTLKMTTYPATYTGVKEKTYATAAAINNTTWDNLTAGIYVFTLSESSICSSTATATVEVKRVALSALPNLFSNLYSYKSYYSTATELENNYALTAYCGYSYNQGSTEYYKYLIKLSQYLEYAIIYPEDGTPNPLDPSHVWTTLPNYTGSSYRIPLTNLRYDIDAIRTDQTNKKPQVYVRVKGCPDIARIFTISLYTNTPSLYSEKNGCDNYIRSYWYKTMPISYPASWELSKETIRGSGNYDIVQSGIALSFQNMPNNYQYFTSENVGGFRYKYKVISASGLEFTSSVFDFSIQSPASILSYTYSSFGCDYLDEAQFFYLSSGNRMADIESLKLLSIEKSTNGGSYVVMTPADPDYSNIAPSFPNWKKADLTPGLLTSSIYRIALWANSLDETVTSNISEATLRARGNIRTLPRERVRYRFKYEVTDVCGFVDSSRYVIFAGLNYYYDYNEPQFNVTSNCGTSWQLRIPNIASLIESNYRGSATAYNTTAYARVVAGPAGAYPSGSYEFVSSAGQSLKLTKPGTYTVKVSLNQTNTSATEACAQYYQLEISEKDTSFELDGNLTAAYRCQNSALGDGYIKLAVKNGSGGPYTFELSQYDNTHNDFVLLETNTTGEFQNWLEKNSDSYKVRVTDSGCSTIRSFEQKLDVLNLSNVPISWVENYNICPGGTIKLHALALGTTTYQWTGPNGWTSTDKDPIITNVGPEHTGIYTVTVTIPFCGGETMAGSVTVSVGISTLYWNPSATDGNWFNNNNWLLADGTTALGHPSPCTTVHIPGNADHYPNLSNDHSPWSLNGQPACDTIVYHYGGETTYPSHLLYNRAIVQYNWGYYDTNPADGTQPTLHKDTNFPANGTRTITQLSRGHWNMLSAPLKNMTGGDFNLGGTPTTYQRLYNIQNPTQGIYPQGTSNHTQPFQKYNIDLSTLCNALAVAVVPYKNNTIGSGDHTHLQATQGIMEMPYILNPSQDAHRPLHTYNNADSTSTFTYYNIETLAPIAGQEDKIQRGYQSYRFVYEQADNKPEKTVVGSDNISIYRMPLVQPHTGNKIMIGNPLMSHIDFDKLYALNTSIISNQYEIVEATTGNTLTYEIGSSNNGTMTKNIPPLQAFIIERLNPTATEDLIFHLDGTSSVITFGSLNEALPKPRNLASQTPRSWIHIESQAQDTLTKRMNKDAIRLLIGSDNTINIHKTIKTEDIAHKAEILLIGQDGKWYSDLNQQNTRGTQTYILGVLTTTTQPITLNITPGGEHIKQVQLKDRYDNTTTDVTNGGQYTFHQRQGWFTGGRDGMDITRFQLIITLK